MNKAEEFKDLLLEAYDCYECTADWDLDKTDPNEVKSYNNHKLEELQAYQTLISFILNNSDEIQRQLMDLIPKD